MKRGSEMEPVAAAEYSALTGNQVFRCGLAINPYAPHLGASPDRKVCAPSEPALGLLGIKCPDKDRVSDCDYLLCQDGKYHLKATHEYYQQVMGQMGIYWHAVPLCLTPSNHARGCGV
ncbi:hypothetical protein ACEWY4_007772 [Coilia grayii]|uniref:YqaJ viral recombinase domain-containing protein n=1 Tax=Coilia grayii TaxID=363190 RepID=A0ABD1K908_9TELE